MRPENLPKAKKVAIALLTPYQPKKKLRTIQPRIFEKIKNSQPELEFTGSYKTEDGRGEEGREKRREEERRGG